MINPLEMNIETIPLDDLKDKNGKFKYHEASELFGMSVKMQYEALKTDIAKVGQIDAIFIIRNKIVNGRNRTKALNELGIETVKVKELPYNSKKEDLIDLSIREENTHRHSTPTQLACNAVKEYYRRKKESIKTTVKDVLEKIPASSANFSSAKWIYDNYPSTFTNLFNGEGIVTHNEHRPTSSLAAIKAYLLQLEKQAKTEKDEREMSEALALENIDNEIESEATKENQDLTYNGKGEAYKAINDALYPLIAHYGKTHKITLFDYAKDLYHLAKKAEDAKKTVKSILGK